MKSEYIGALQPPLPETRRSVAVHATCSPGQALPAERYTREVEILKADLRLTLSNAWRAVEERESALAYLQHDAAELRQERDLLRNQLEATLHSTSWKVTAPIRWFAGRTRSVATLPLRVARFAWWSLRLHLRSKVPQALDRHRSIAPQAVPAPAPRDAETATTFTDKAERLRTSSWMDAVAAGFESNEEPDIWPSDRPLVSVVITSFNYGRYLEQSVDSVMAQTFTDLEVIIVEGGSTDLTSRETALSLIRPRVRVLAQATPHPAGANRNLGISGARGKYVCCLDADDWVAPTYIEKAVFLLEEYGYDVVSSACQLFGDRSNVVWGTRTPTLADMLEANHLQVCGVFRRKWWAQAGGYRDAGPSEAGHVHEDWAFWVRLAAMGTRMFNMNRDALFFHRKHEASVTQTRDLGDKAAQRAQVRQSNADVISPAALEASQRVWAEDRRPAVPLRNLGSHGPEKCGDPVLLLALPYTVIGGAERLLSGVVRHLVGRGWQVIIVTSIDPGPEYGDTSAWFEQATKQVYHLPRFLAPERWEGFVRYLIASRNVDVLWIAGSAFAYDLLPGLHADFPRMRVADLLFNTVGHTLSNRKHAGYVDLTLVENEEVRDFLLDAGEAEERIAICPSGIDLEALRPAPRDPDVVEATGAQSTDIIVGFSGRWSEEKSPVAFIEIASRVPASVPARFVMTGTGPMRAAVEDAVSHAALPPGRIHLAGAVADAAVWIRSLDVLVVPSRLDGRPVVAMEALALGVPVVASRVGALPELVKDGENGFVCAPGDIDSFAERIARLAEDRGLLTRMKIEARRWAERSLDGRATLRRYEELLRDLVATR